MVDSIDYLSPFHILLFVLYFFAANVVLFICGDLFRKRDIFKFAAKLNGYNFYPVIGNGYHFIGEDIFTGIQKLVKKYNLPCNLWSSHDYTYVTADIGEIKVILNHPNTLDKSSLYANFQPVFGNSLLLAPYNEWKKHRKIFAKSFSQPILNSFVDVFYKKSCILVKVLKDELLRDKYDIFEKFSLDNFCANIMGLDLDAQISLDQNIIEIERRLQDMFAKRLLSSYLCPEIIWFYTPEGRKARKDVTDLKEIIYKVIQRKRKVFAKNRDFRENADKLPLMDMMLEDEGKRFSDEKIFQEVILFLLAATDTSGITLAFTFTLLGMHPDVQEKVYQEVIQVIGDRPVCLHDLPNLRYTERALSESMRLLPVTPFVGRRATADIDLGTRVLPAGSNILISVFNVHRSETHWPNPTKYDPDRFLPEEVAKRDPYCFIPFSGGPRNCIGLKYAMMMMKTAVANVVRNYEISSNYISVDDLELTSCITMKTVHDLDCRFTPRSQ